MKDVEAGDSGGGADADARGTVCFVCSQRVQYLGSLARHASWLVLVSARAPWCMGARRRRSQKEI